MERTGDIPIKRLEPLTIFLLLITNIKRVAIIQRKELDGKLKP